jgi:hypothetical protein
MRLAEYMAPNFNNTISAAAVFLDIEKEFDTTQQQQELRGL